MIESTPSDRAGVLAASYLHETRETWQKIADRLMERIADLARAAPGG